MGPSGRPLQADLLVSLPMEHSNHSVSLPGVGDALINSDGKLVGLVVEVLKDDIVVTNRPMNRVAEQAPSGKWYLAGSGRDFTLVPSAEWSDLARRAAESDEP